MSNDIETKMYAIRSILNSVPDDKYFVRLTPIIYGKTIEGIPIKSRDSLTQRKIIQYRHDLINIFKNWTTSGHEDWYAKQISGLHFTVKFIRKDSEEGRKYREANHEERERI